MSAEQQEQRVWLVTGTSSGFGNVLVNLILARGDKVIATARNVDNIAALKDAGAFTLALDVTHTEDEIKTIIDKAHSAYGRIDVLINNAGYGQFGVIEELSYKQMVAQYETNIFGLLKVTQAVLPHMRARKSGVIINMGSVAGYHSAPVMGCYASTKFALEGITEALRGEVASFGISVCVVEPGHFGTDLLNNMHHPAREMEEYKVLNGRIHSFIKHIVSLPSNDLSIAMLRVIQLATKTGMFAGKEIPEKFAIGVDAYSGIKKKCERVLANLEEFKDATTTDLSLSAH